MALVSLPTNKLMHPPFCFYWLWRWGGIWQRNVNTKFSENWPAISNFEREKRTHRQRGCYTKKHNFDIEAQMYSYETVNSAVKYMISVFKRNIQ